jgi:hypothetical protein
VLFNVLSESNSSESVANKPLVKGKRKGGGGLFLEES